MAKPNDPYLVAIPPVPLLALATTLDIKPAGYFHREVFAQTAVDYGGTDGADGRHGRDGKDGFQQPGENGAPGQHGSPATSGLFIDAKLESMNPNVPEEGVCISVTNKRFEIGLPPATGVLDTVAVISVRGGFGGNGGNGGHSGSGDMGSSHGGRGGAGGAAGHGGFCRVTSANPYLFMLMRIDLRPGEPGEGGTGGGGGYSGARGPMGPEADFGGAEYALVTPDGSILEESVSPYHLQIITYNIIDDMQDNILEPGEGFTISGVQLVNAGGLTLPNGARFQFCNTDTITFEPHDIVIGALPPGGAIILPNVIRGRIHEVPEPTAPGPFHGVAKFPSSASLLNRQFQQGSVWSQLHTQYPIILSKIAYPQQMARGDINELRIGIKNVSTREYGLDEATRVTLRISSHPFFVHQLPGWQVGADGYPFTDFPVANLLPGSEQLLVLPVQLTPQGPELFERYPFKAELFIRQKKVELDEAVIRCAPRWEEYAQLQEPEAIVFCGHHWSRPEYLLWMRLFAALAVQAQLWDFDYYKGISFDMRTMKRHQPDGWVRELVGGGPHRRVLIFPSGKRQNLQTLVMEDIYKHFTSFPSLVELMMSTPALDEHGVILFGVDENETRNQLMWSGIDFDLTKHFKDSMFGKADEKDAKKMAGSLLKKLNATEFFHKISTLKIQPVNVKGRDWNFGEMRVKRCAFRKNSRVQALADPMFGFLDQRGIPGDGIIDLNCNYGALFCRIVAAMPFRVRFGMMTKARPFVERWRVVRRVNDDQKQDVTLLDFMMLLCYQDVRTDFSVKDKQRPKLEALTVCIESNPEAYKNIDVLATILYVFKRAHKKASFTDKSAEKRKERVKAALWGKQNKKDSNYSEVDKMADKAIDHHGKKIKITTFIPTPNGVLLFDFKDD